MRRSSTTVTVALSAALLAGCAQTGSDVSADRRALGPELLPFAAPAAEFRVWGGAQRRLVVERVDDLHVRLRLEDVGVLADVEHRVDGLYFSDEPGIGSLLIKFGASPGAEWATPASRVKFEGWERLDLPAGVFDAAHVSESVGPETFVHRMSWWFAPDVGLVRIVVNRAGLDARELVRTGR
jgi:hypothetical protein